MWLNLHPVARLLSLSDGDIFYYDGFLSLWIWVLKMKILQLGFKFSLLYILVYMVMLTWSPWVGELLNIVIILPWSIFEESILDLFNLNLPPRFENILIRRFIHISYNFLGFYLNFIILNLLLKLSRFGINWMKVKCKYDNHKNNVSSG